MPFSSDGDTIDFIYGVINWKRRRGSRAAREPAAVPRRKPRPTRLRTRTSSISTTSSSSKKPRSSSRHGRDRGREVAIEPEAEETPDVDPYQVASAHGALRLGGRPAPRSRIRTSPAGNRISTTTPVSPIGCGPRARPPMRSSPPTAAPAPRSTARCRTPMILRSPPSATPQDYAELLEESGVKAQARAPMTPIVKLVFGDRLRQGAADRIRCRAVLMRAARTSSRAASSSSSKARPAASRRWSPPNARQSGRSPSRTRKAEAAKARLRAAAPIALETVSAESEFALVLARRRADGGVEAGRRRRRRGDGRAGHPPRRPLNA